MKNSYVFVPGAWMGDWVCRNVSQSLQDKGHDVYSLTLTGLEAHSDVDPSHIPLTTHVQDVSSYLRQNDLEAVILVGHSYSGIAVGQLASQLRVVIAHTVFIKVFLPVDGKSLLEISGLDAEHERGLIANNGGWRPAPTYEALKGQRPLTNHQIRYIDANLTGHPGNTIDELARLENALVDIRATCIARDDWLSNSSEPALLETLKKRPNWSFKSIDGGHWPMVTMPHDLAEMLAEISATMK